MPHVLRRLASLIRDESGQDLVEYALLAALVGIACVAAWDGIASAVQARYGRTTAGAGGLWDTPPPGR
jgi:pilus assembly protein Flp/PilA